MSEQEYVRLSDKILDALKISLDQEDKQISELLCRAMELSLTRNTGGGDFKERREISDEVTEALDRAEKLHSS